MAFLPENRTFLIVDDEAKTLQAYGELLAPRLRSDQRTSAIHVFSEGYNLLLARSGEEAVEIVRTEYAAGRRVAAGLFDIKLGGGMGILAAIAAIRALDNDFHCVIVTALSSPSVDEIHQFFGEGFKAQWDYLNRPLTPGEIVQKARQMVGAWNREREREAFHAQRVRSERLAAVSQVARGIGHEFGNILLRIIGKTDLALMEKDVNKVHGHLKVVMTAAERAGAIVRNLQAFSRTEPQFHSASLTGPLDEALSVANHELSKVSIKLEKKYDPVPNVLIDTVGLSQAFLNLMLNAAFAMPKGGVLSLIVEKAPGPDGRRSGVSVRIADTGTGIAPDVLPRIFDFAFTTKGDRGSGLGLSVSREIVESQGGCISVKTEPGKGSEFTVWLPQ